MRKPLTTALTALGIIASILMAAPADAAPSATHYTNCTAVHRAYSGGIARAGVHYNTVHHAEHRALKGYVKFSTALYNANKRLDRDRDGIACEKS